MWFDNLGSTLGAWISDCGLYRTLLWRTIDGTRAPLVFAMLNQSTADAQVDDPTIRRCMGFARRESAGGIVVVNLSPYRTAYPRDLNAARKAGVDVLRRQDNNVAYVAARELGCGRFVLAWGASIPGWLDNAARNLRAVAGPGARCLGKTGAGEPRHPLMLRNDTPLVSYP